MERNAREAAEDLFRTHGTRLLRLAALYLGDVVLAEDAVQETYLKVIKGYGKFQGQGELSTWATRILINTCKDIRRAGWFRRLLSSQPLHLLPEPAAPMAETDRGVVQAVMGLPAKYREILLLHYWQGLDARQISLFIGISENAVYTRLSRARGMLKPILKGEYEDEQPHQAGI